MNPWEQTLKDLTVEVQGKGVATQQSSQKKKKKKKPNFGHNLLKNISA